jgi:hypothetical protein
MLLQLYEPHSQPSIVGPLGETSVSTDGITGQIFNILLLFFLNLLYRILLYVSSNQSHIINRHKQAIHSFK